jgi:hypothetical protein
VKSQDAATRPAPGGAAEAGPAGGGIVRPAGESAPVSVELDPKAAKKEVRFLDSRSRGYRICFIIDRSFSMHFTVDGDPAATKSRAGNSQLSEAQFEQIKTAINKVAADPAAKPDLSQLPKAPSRAPKKESFATGDGLRLVKQELVKTLGSMAPADHFFVVFFNEGPHPMPGGTWKPAAHRQAIEDWMNSIQPVGGTQPCSSFELAFALDPPPDVIFFMTDGIFDREEVDGILRLNTGSKKTQINTILFANSKSQGFRDYFGPVLLDALRAQRAGLRLPSLIALEPDEILREIAYKSGGTFTIFELPKR